MIAVAAKSNMLLPTKAASRDAVDSSRPGERSTGSRHATRPNPPSITRPRKIRYAGPTADCAKACTDDSTLPRVRNVPNVMSENAPITKEMFQSRAMPRRSCNMIECRNAVETSHGSNATFSTGSHAQ